jgi:DHA1 family bicyclomycin/chloramphenicol resistance-like MFS transporter
MSEPIPRLRLIVILGALSAFGPLATDMYLPAFPALARAFSTDAAAVQGTLATYFVGLGLGQAIWGPISDRYGRKPSMLFGLALFVAASIACALATSIESLWIFRFVQALGGSVGMVLGRAAVRDVYVGAEAAHFYSRLLIVLGMAPVIAPFLGGQILSVLGWRWIFWALGSFGIACFLSVWLQFPETLPLARRASGGLGAVLKDYGKLLRDRHFLGFTLPSNFAFAGMFAYIAGSPFVFIELFGVSPERFGLLFGLNAIGIVIASQINAYLVYRFGPALLLRVALLVYFAAAIALFIAAFTKAGLVAVAAPLFFAVAMMGVVPPNSMALALEPYPRSAGSASALSGAMQFSVGAPIVALLGVLHDGSALPMASIVIGCGLVALAINLASTSRAREVQPD